MFCDHSGEEEYEKGKRGEDCFSEETDAKDMHAGTNAKTDHPEAVASLRERRKEAKMSDAVDLPETFGKIYSLSTQFKEKLSLSHFSESFLFRSLLRYLLKLIGIDSHSSLFLFFKLFFRYLGNIM